jgi:uncharacterized protein (TIGR02246 family)
MAGDDAARRAIAAVVNAVVAAWNRHDAAAYAAPFAEDADFTSVFGLLAKGRAAIEASHAAIFKTMFKDSHLTADETRIRFIRPDVAAVDVRWTMTGARDPQGKVWPARQGLLNQIVTEQRGTWSIAVSHNMDLPPPERIRALAALLKR